MTPERTEISVTLHGSPPWGFRISGGKEFHQPLVVARVSLFKKFLTNETLTLRMNIKYLI